ncbi:MAG TPA: hypothetical protein VGP82_22200 [Ktedonobacterales bacterium]|jgi:hypothetical protein|nr:hypothetical protein [Ktedonobacterales bacterium]
MVPVRVEGVRRNVGISSVYMYTAALVAKAPPFPADDLEGRKHDYLKQLLPDGRGSWG